VLDVRTVPADAHADALADVDRVDRRGVDLAEVLDERAQTAAVAVDTERVGGAEVALVLAEVELLEPGHTLARARSDLVEVRLHHRGEVVVDEPVEVLLEQADHREREPRRHEGLAAGHDVAAVLDRRDGRRVRRRPDRKSTRLNSSHVKISYAV